MVARPHGQSVNGEVLRWYSQKDLAEMWRVHPGTIRNWIWRLRREGRGPAGDQAKYYFYYGARRDLMLRHDYVILMQDWCMK